MQGVSWAGECTVKNLRNSVEAIKSCTKKTCVTAFAHDSQIDRLPHRVYPTWYPTSGTPHVVHLTCGLDGRSQWTKWQNCMQQNEKLMMSNHFLMGTKLWHMLYVLMLLGSISWQLPENTLSALSYLIVVQYEYNYSKDNDTLWFT